MAVRRNGVQVVVNIGGGVRINGGESGTIPIALIPPTAISDPRQVADAAARLALLSDPDNPVDPGEWVVQLDDQTWWLTVEGPTYIQCLVLTAAQAAQLASLAADLAALAPLDSPTFTAQFRGPVEQLTGPTTVTGKPGVIYLLDLSGGAITISAWSSPQPGDAIEVCIEAGDPATNNATVCGLPIDSGDTDSAWVVQRFASEWRKRGG